MLDTGRRVSVQTESPQHTGCLGRVLRAGRWKQQPAKAVGDPVLQQGVMDLVLSVRRNNLITCVFGKGNLSFTRVGWTA